MSRSFSLGAPALLFAAALLAGPAQAQQYTYGSVDPNQYARPAGAPVTVMPEWQTNPFQVGYSLVGGYRPLYSGAAQPIGHETISTHGGNGYVYRPVYGAQPYYAPQYFGSYGVVPSRSSWANINHGSRGHELVIDNPGTPYESRYSPGMGAGTGHAALLNVMPQYIEDSFYGSDYALRTAYPEPFAYAPGADESNIAPQTAEELPSGDLRLPDGTIVPKSNVKPAPPRAPAPKPAPKKTEF
ncbi:MAG: hypothetical protein C0483_23370 [Pirellula sp.]|nr:hypothetical protein [Pirellula sp.]